MSLKLVFVSIVTAGVQAVVADCSCIEAFKGTGDVKLPKCFLSANEAPGIVMCYVGPTCTYKPEEGGVSAID